jgi:hypothetical protein
MKNTAKRDEILAVRKQTFKELQDNTRDWIGAALKREEDRVAELKNQRELLIKKSHESYWELDPYVRSRSIYDRTGVLLPGGKINFYSQPKEKEMTGSQTASPSADAGKEEKSVEAAGSGGSAEKLAAEIGTAGSNNVEANEIVVPAS